MRCEVCQRPMTLIFTSYGCDHCDGKLPIVSQDGCAAPTPSGVWAALILKNGCEVSAPDYHRVQAQASQHSGTFDFVFPTAFSHWGFVIGYSLMDSQTGSEKAKDCFGLNVVGWFLGNVVGKGDVITVTFGPRFT